ncbi:MAG: hypothetical protein WD097_04490 [Balneolales bacterium]
MELQILHKSGYVETQKQEPLLPTQTITNHRQEAAVTSKSNRQVVTQNDEMLLPAGLILNTDGTISDREEQHIQTLKASVNSQKDEDCGCPDDDNILMPNVE